MCLCIYDGSLRVGSPGLRDLSSYTPFEEDTGCTPRGILKISQCNSTPLPQTDLPVSAHSRQHVCNASLRFTECVRIYLAVSLCFRYSYSSGSIPQSIPQSLLVKAGLIQYHDSRRRLRMSLQLIFIEQHLLAPTLQPQQLPRLLLLLAPNSERIARRSLGVRSICQGGFRESCKRPSHMNLSGVVSHCQHLHL